MKSTDLDNNDTIGEAAVDFDREAGPHRTARGVGVAEFDPLATVDRPSQSPTRPISHTASESLTDSGTAPTAAVSRAKRFPRGDASDPITPSARGLSREVDSTRYRVGARLGRGGMGEVLSAFDEQIGREVAVKRMLSETSSSDSFARFLREARVQGRLEHPAVVPVHDLAIDAEGRPYFVMKRLTGTTMSELLSLASATRDPKPIRRRLWRAFVDVCLAVEFAHQRRIVHRDLKPANIMLGDFGEVYVLDWGIARAIGAVIADRPSRQHMSEHPLGSRKQGDSGDLALDNGETLTGTVLGTPGYMAPEQMDGDAADASADVYALGCILFEISAGQPLHPRGQGAMVSTASGADARVSMVVADSPPEIDAMCVHATQLNPAMRIGSARELADRMQSFLDGDRDVEARRKLAAEHIAVARRALADATSASATSASSSPVKSPASSAAITAAFAETSSEEFRRAAMRAAGRALALDPTARDAAEIVTRLMLEPPKEVPAEVERRIEEIDTETARAQGRIAAVSLFGYVAFLPILLWTGVRNWPVVVSFLLLSLASALQIWILTRRSAISTSGIYLNVCINAVLIGLISRICGPFFVAPTLAATTLMAYAAHPRFGRIFIVSSLLASSIFVPWALELLGVLQPTYQFISGALVLTSPVIAFRALPIQIAFAISLLALLAVVAVLSRMMAQRQRDAARKLEMAAWHMRQLVPQSDES